jgi:hypothetical protein
MADTLAPGGGPLMPLDVVLDATRELLEGQSPLARWRSTIFDDLQDVFLF